MESREMDLQMEIHSTNLDYKRKRDQASAKNSRISLLHQLAVVQAISNLIEALACLNPPRLPDTIPAQARPPTTDTATPLLAPQDGH